MKHLSLTLKGLTAQIGVMELRNLAEQLELSLRRGEDRQQILALQEHLIPNLMELINQLKEQLPIEDQSQHNSITINIDELRQVCTKLTEQLVMDDFTSCDTFHKHQELLRTALGEKFIAIANDIQNFNFSNALIELKNMMINHGINL